MAYNENLQFFVSRKKAFVAIVDPSSLLTRTLLRKHPALHKGNTLGWDWESTPNKVLYNIKQGF